MIEQALANPIVAQFVGLVVGLFTSFFSWWVLFRWMAPVITISDSISKTASKIALDEDDDKSGYRYRIKFENSGRRSIVDLEIRTYLRIKGLTDPNSTIWRVVHLPMDTDGEKIYSISLMTPARKSKLRTRLRICLNHTDYFTKPVFPPDIREKARNKALLLEDLMSLGASRELRVIVSGYDEFSGARKMFMNTYLLPDIKAGEFDKKGLGVIEDEPST